VTLAIFVAAYVLLWVTGVTSMKHLVGHVVALYLISWGLYTLLSDLPRAEIRTRFVLITGSLLITTGLLEIPSAVGLLDYREIVPPRTTELWTKPEYLVDQELIWIRKPFSQQKGTYVRGNIGDAICSEASVGQEFDLRYDRHGFRNESDLERADIAVIGDSYVEAPMIKHSDLLTSRLAQLQRTSVANLGQLGYGPQQELVVLKRYAVHLQPKTVVWVFFEGNDLDGVKAYHERAAMVASRDKLDAFWERSLTRSILSRFLVPTGCVPHSEIQRQYGYVKDSEGQRQRFYFVSQELPVLDLIALTETRNILREAYELCRRDGIDFIVAFAPSKYRVYHQIADFSETADSVKHWELNDLPEQMRSSLMSISPGIGFLDLTPALQRESAKGVLTYLPDDTHWSADGHRVVGEAIHHMLLSRQNHRKVVLRSSE
jgi:hypothetical protein